MEMELYVFAKSPEFKQRSCLQFGRNPLKTNDVDERSGTLVVVNTSKHSLRKAKIHFVPQFTSDEAHHSRSTESLH